MTYDYEVELIKIVEPEDPDAPTTDDDGNQIIETAVDKILCGKKSITGNEFYKAATAGIKPTITLVIHPYEYFGQDRLKFEGKYYRVIRTYEVDIDNIELTCETILADEQ
jgi:SPP1 family predicted phage head-tail adaptor